jgi:hypothetical protein
VPKRPSLTEVMKGPEPSPEKERRELLAEAEPPRKVGKKRRGWVQLNAYVPEETRTKVKIKALQEGKDLSDVVNELLDKWIDS